MYLQYFVDVKHKMERFIGRFIHCYSFQIIVSLHKHKHTQWHCYKYKNNVEMQLKHDWQWRMHQGVLTPMEIWIDAFWTRPMATINWVDHRSKINVNIWTGWNPFEKKLRLRPIVRFHCTVTKVQWMKWTYTVSFETRKEENKEGCRPAITMA